MPSIQDIVKKNKTKMFKQANARQLEEVLPFTQEIVSIVEPVVEPIKVVKKEFKKVPYRPWDDDEPTQTEGEGRRPTSSRSENVTEQLVNEDLIDEKPMSQTRGANIITALPGRERDKNNPTRMIISLYGVQRNILKFLIQNISHEEDPFVYTFPIDLKSIVLFTSSSKRTVETSIRRMKEKQLIESWDHKRGRGGYVSFRIPYKLRDEFLNQNNKPIQTV